MSTAASIRRGACGADVAAASPPPEVDAASAPLGLTIRWRFARLRRDGADSPGSRRASSIDEGELGLVAAVSADGEARISAWIDDADGHRDLMHDRPARARRVRWDGHLHLELASGDDAAPAITLVALFRIDRAEATPRMVYARSEAPVVAGLAGATYEITAATLTPG